MVANHSDDVDILAFVYNTILSAHLPMDTRLFLAFGFYKQCCLDTSSMSFGHVGECPMSKAARFRACPLFNFTDVRQFQEDV